MFSLTQITSPSVMGILNVTPDSFSDGGINTHVERAVENALLMVEQGAAIIDIGGESTRPGAQAVDIDSELARVVPVVEQLRRHTDIPISIDTHKPEVMRAGIGAGANMINDINALRTPGALDAAADLGVPVCLMHMQGEPRTMQHDPRYGQVVDDVTAFLLERVQMCVDAGIKKSEIALDPGFGFGKTVQHNYALFNAIPQMLELGYPLLVGVSRKSMLGVVTHKTVEKRLAASIAAATLAAQWGAHIIRVHDVDETVDAIRIVEAIKNNNQ
ncbi:dihydropteroate synthase [Alteromonas facilis]|uniref:dihydropteroate synthase n=1 Tax=Alteromonas facilis TaxID=2048004 RepID=UPI000C287592|nr:dihydropteroate synthase [Alteromonas facilis]